MRVIDADTLEREGWFLSRNRQVDSKTMVYEVKKPTEFPTIEPQPCEDAISREEAKWVVFCNRDHVEDQANAIDELPAVMPKRKTGKWLPETEDWRNQIIWVECSECGFSASTSYNFCPNCGADMRGEQDE